MARNQKAQTIHHEIAHFALFNTGETALSEDIGLRCRFINPRCPAEQDDFTITAIQKNYRGDLCYRVVGDTDSHSFGCVAHPSDVEIIKGES